MPPAPSEYSSAPPIGPCLYCGAPPGARPLTIGADPAPAGLLKTLALVRAAAAHANGACGDLEAGVARSLEDAARRLAQQPLEDLRGPTIWQDNGGAAIAYPVDLLILQGAVGARVIDPTAVRRNQCADAVQTAIQVAVLQICEADLEPALARLEVELVHKAQAWAGLIKIGRTHLQDAAPLTLGQEVSAYVQQVRNGRARLRAAAEALLRVPLGRGCVGTGAGVPRGFAKQAVDRLATLSGLPVQPSAHALVDLSGPASLAFLHAAFATLAASLFKIASDVTLLASGPSAGFNELRLPDTGLVCSSLPGKQNPDAAEALALVCAQVIGADSAVGFASSQVPFEGPAPLPVLAFNLLRSARLLSDAVRVFAEHGVAGLEPRPEVLEANVRRSVMLVTALAPHIGYDAAAKIARDAYRRNLDLREAAIASGQINAATFDRLVRPGRLRGPAAT